MARAMLQTLTLLSVMVLSVVVPVATAAFTFDSNSDLAQQLYRRSQTNSSADRIKLATKDIPQSVQKRLDAYKLTFDVLDGFLQRVLL